MYVKRGIGTFVAAALREVKSRQGSVARQIAEKMLREAYRQGVLASDLIAALEEIAPNAGARDGSGSGAQKQVAGESDDEDVRCPAREDRREKPGLADRDERADQNPVGEAMTIPSPTP